MSSSYPLPLRTAASTPRTTRTVLNFAETGLKTAVRELCRTNFLIFQKIELGFEIGPQHRTWWNDLRTGKDIVELAPRDHGKSHSLARALPLWKLKYDPWTRDVLLLGADQPSAIENLDKLKELMEARPSVRHLLPQGRSMTNSRTEMRLTNGKVIKAKGMMSPLRGRHPQLIVGDDILNEANSWSAEVRKETEAYFNQVVVPMKDKGTARARAQGFHSLLAVVGTAQDEDDLYHHMLANPEYAGTLLSAIIDDETKQVLWEDRYSYEDLMAIKRRINSLAFSKEYLNQPLTDETTIFPTSLFTPLFDTQLEHVLNHTSGKPVYIGVDFSVPGSTDGDWTVIVAIEYDPEQNLYTLLNYWRARPEKIHEQTEKIEYYCQAYNATLCYVEDNSFQAIYREHFKNKSNLPIRGHTVTATNKKSLDRGIVSLRTIFENETFRFPYKTDRDKQKTDMVVKEFNGVRQRFGRIGNEAANDDIVMALWHAISASRATSFSADFG